MGEVAGLRAENARLTGLAARALELERENSDLKRLTRFAGAPGIERVSARVIAASPSALARTLLIDAGRNQGVRDGFPVASGEGLLGRVVQAGDDSATVRLLSDRLSRVPVFIGKQQARGLLTGTGTGPPRLEFVAGDVPVAAGDVVTTSGLGGVFPRGLAVGVVVAEGAGWRVALTAADDAPFAVGVLQVEVPVFDAGEVLSRKAEREPAGSRLKAAVK
jgi:rod shape-determining protein MreC